MSDVENLLRQMTVQEKVALLAGTNHWYTVPVERLGIPSLKMTDGPNGARGAGGFTAGVKAACFPAGISLASTWNSDLVARVGQALAREAKMKGAQVLLGPTVNIQRSPLGGRNFECFSEDPYLSARLAVAYITGLQREGVGASIKHYVCNDQEFERFSISSEVRERALREIWRCLVHAGAARSCSQPSSGVRLRKQRLKQACVACCCCWTKQASLSTRKLSQSKPLIYRSVALWCEKRLPRASSCSRTHSRFCDFSMSNSHPWR